MPSPGTAMRIYVGNLSYRSSEQDVHKAFTVFGTVARTQLAIDPATGRSAGFAYVEMPNEEEALTAIARLNGKEISSRVVTVSLATPEEPAFRPERERSARPERSGRFGREARDGVYPRRPGPGAAGDRRSGDRRSGDRRSGDRPAASGQRPRSEHVRSDPSPSAPTRRTRSPDVQPRGGSRPGSIWDQRRRSEPPTAQRRDSETKPKDLPQDPPSGGPSAVEQPANPPDPPATDNPWTRRRPKTS